MPTFTPKLNLKKPLGGELIEEGDYNGNFDILDAASGMGVVTSGTRPSTDLFNGRQIYETDTFAYAIYLTSVSGWRYLTPPTVANYAALAGLPNQYNSMRAITADNLVTWTRMAGVWNTPDALGIWGGYRITGSNNLGGAVTNVSGELVPSNMHTPSIDLLPRRAYRVFVQYTALGSGTGDTYLLRIREGSVAGTGGTQMGQSTHVVPNTSLNVTEEFEGFYETGVSAVTKVFSMTGQMIAGSGTLQFKGGGTGATNPTGVAVYDIGPANKLTSVAS